MLHRLFYLVAVMSAQVEIEDLKVKALDSLPAGKDVQESDMMALAILETTS